MRVLISPLAQSWRNCFFFSFFASSSSVEYLVTFHSMPLSSVRFAFSQLLRRNRISRAGRLSSARCSYAAVQHNHENILEKGKKMKSDQFINGRLPSSGRVKIEDFCIRLRSLRIPDKLRTYFRIRNSFHSHSVQLLTTEERNMRNFLVSDNRAEAKNH